MRRPDWRRLGASFGVPDVCVEFPAPATVHHESGPVAERAIALRESAEGVAIEVECGLVLRIPGARLDALGPGLESARLSGVPLVALRRLDPPS